VTYEEYVEELMRLLFQALARPGPGEEEPASSQEGEGKSTKKKTKNFSAGGLQSLPDMVYYAWRG
jgi:hypothetical protein